MIHDFGLYPATTPGPEEQKYHEWEEAQKKKGMVGPGVYTYTLDDPPKTREELFKTLNSFNSAVPRRMTAADYGEGI